MPGSPIDQIPIKGSGAYFQKQTGFIEDLYNGLYSSKCRTPLTTVLCASEQSRKLFVFLPDDAGRAGTAGRPAPRRVRRRLRRRKGQLQVLQPKKEEEQQLV